jgi:hypothetical protein
MKLGQSIIYYTSHPFLPLSFSFALGVPQNARSNMAVVLPVPKDLGWNRHMDVGNKTAEDGSSSVNPEVFRLNSA